MADPDIPRLAFPPRFEYLPDGTVRLAIVEQDGPDDVYGMARIIARVPIGWRDELPEFGTPRDELEMIPADSAQVRAAFETWAPGLAGEVTEQGNVVDAAIREVRVEVLEAGTVNGSHGGRPTGRPPEVPPVVPVATTFDLATFDVGTFGE